MPSSALKQKIPPGPNAHKILNVLPEIRKADFRIFYKFIQSYGDLIRFRLGPRVLYFLDHPDFAKHVLLTHHQNYTKETRAWKMLRTVLGASIFVTSGEEWRKRRRLMQPLFNPAAISYLFPMMNRVIEEMIQDFSDREAKGEVLEIRSEMMRVTLRIIGETIMGTDVARHVNAIGQALETILQHIADNYIKIFNIPLFVPTPRNLKYRRALRTLDEIIYEVIRKRRQSHENPDDLLSRLMAARNEENGRCLNDTEIRDEIMTMFLAGHETTANTLSWIWFLLSQNPEIEERVYNEVKSQIKNWPPTKEELSKLNYTVQVMEETLRLYPPVWVVSRCNTQADEIGGYHIPEKSTVFLCPYSLHRKQPYWPDPEKFDPDRFSPQNKGKIQPFSYLPFLEGPRKCLGYHFAMIESPLIMAAVVRNFRVRLVPTHPVEVNFTVTLRPRYGIKMILEKRDKR